MNADNLDLAIGAIDSHCGEVRAWIVYCRTHRATGNPDSCARMIRAARRSLADAKAYVAWADEIIATRAKKKGRS